MRELIVDGKSGLVVDTETAAVAAVADVAHLDRAAVRDHAATFSVDRMVDGYLRVYHRLIHARISS